MKSKNKYVALISILVLTSGIIYPSLSKARIGVWDGVIFEFGSEDGVKYSHPKKDSYGIEPWYQALVIGTHLYHHMLDQMESDLLIDVPAAGLGAAIGAIIGLLLGTLTKDANLKAILGAIGGILGGILSPFLSAIPKNLLQDEDGNIWLWLSKSFTDWLVQSAAILAFWFIFWGPFAISLITAQFLNLGYLHLGPFLVFSGAHMLSIGAIPQT